MLRFFSFWEDFFLFQSHYILSSPNLDLIISSHKNHDEDPPVAIGGDDSGLGG